MEAATPIQRHKTAIRLRQLVWDQLYTLDSEYRQFEGVIEAELV